MALLDVSEVLNDPLFTSEVELIHVEEGLDAQENAVWIDADKATIQAVVTSDMKTLERLPESLYRQGTILVRTSADNLPSGFQGAGYDAVVWRGRRFTVKDVSDYGQFGRGFIRLVCWPEEVSDGSY